MITSNPCPFSDASIAVCCLDLMALVIVKTMACRMGRPSASSSSSTSASARTPIVASSVVARMGVSKRSALDVARDTNRDATPSRSTMTIRPSASCCLIVRTNSDSPTSDLTAIRGGRVPQFDQIVIERFGSQSRTTTSAPAWASSVANITEAVDLPDPPFGEATVTTGMAQPIYGDIGFIIKPGYCKYPVLYPNLVFCLIWISTPLGARGIQSESNSAGDAAPTNGGARHQRQTEQCRRGQENRQRGRGGGEGPRRGNARPAREHSWMRQYAIPS